LAYLVPYLVISHDRHLLNLDLGRLTRKDELAAYAALSTRKAPRARDILQSYIARFCVNAGHLRAGRCAGVQSVVSHQRLQKKAETGHIAHVDMNAQEYTS
jgi:hypothetical protein